MKFYLVVDLFHTDGAKKQRFSDKDMLIHRPTNNQATLKSSFNGSPTTVHMNGTSAGTIRPQSAKKKVFYKSKDSQEKLTVNIRPYSATLDSPYSQKLTHSSPPRRAKSGRKMNKTTYN